MEINHSENDDISKKNSSNFYKINGNNPPQKYIQNQNNYNSNKILTDKNIERENIDSDINMNNSSEENFNTLQHENKSLKKQIKLLTNRIQAYENDCMKDKRKCSTKEFSKLEIDLNKKINNKEQIINSIKQENKYLKKYINQMDNDIDVIKDEVKNLLSIKREKEKKREREREKENININNQNINSYKSLQDNNDINDNLANLVKNYSNEITYLKQQNSHLINNLKLMNYNNTINDEISKMKKIQEEEKNITNNFAKEINKELFIISQWIETYLVNQYNYNNRYEIPSFFKHFQKNNNINDKINLINFDILKESLEKSYIQFNSIINNKETQITNLTNIIKEKDNKYNELKLQLIQMKQYQTEINDEKERKRNFSSKSLSSNLTGKDKNINYNNYIKNLYEIIQKEINSILSDINLTVYHGNLIDVKEKDNFFIDSNYFNYNLLEEKLNNSLFKLIEFIEELKYDYLNIKNENIDVTKEKVNNTSTSNIYLKGNISQNEDDKELIEEYKYKIEELIKNNKMLKEQINILNKNKEIKIYKKNIISPNIEKIELENKNLKNYNDNLLNKLKTAKENYLVLQTKNNELKQKIIKIKKDDNDKDNLGQKNSNLSFDCKRILKKNNSFKKGFDS